MRFLSALLLVVGMTADTKCTEDMPCWDGRAMGNHQIADTVYVWIGDAGGLYMGFPA